MSKLVTTVIVVIFLFFYNTEITLILFLILALSYFTLYFLFNQKFLGLGKKLIKENEKKYLIVQETLFGIKEIKLFNLKDYYN
ncbi:ABC transporter transmembrane domain-containing protein [Candidatus Pelagibacter sp. Uisw_114]